MRKISFHRFFVVVAVSFCGPLAALASPLLTYHGRLLTADGDPVASSQVDFRVRIYSPGPERCLLYDEQYRLNLSASKGVFAINIGAGDSTLLQANTETIPREKIFRNQAKFTFGANKCASGYSEYTPGSSDGRVLQVSFNDGTLSDWEELPDQVIAHVPLAIESMTVGGFTPGNLFRVLDGAGDPVAMSPWTQTDYTKLLNLVGGSSPSYAPAGHTHEADEITSAPGKYFVYHPNGAACTPGQVLKWQNSRWECGDDNDTGGGGVTLPIAIGDVTNLATELGDKLDISDMPASCGSGQTLNFSSPTGTWTCANVSVDWTNVTGRPATFAPGPHGHYYGDLQNQTGAYLNYRPDGAACTDGQVLKWEDANSRWVCGSDQAGVALTHFAENLHTTAPNDTYPAVELRPVHTLGTADVVIGHYTGGGALQAQVADGTPTGGNKRGVFAVDWQRMRVSADQVAGGAFSVIAGGNGNRASGDRSFAMGESNHAQGYASVAFGVGTYAEGYAAVTSGLNSHASGYSAVAMGFNSQATGYAGIALGNQSVASGTSSVAIGRDVNSSGDGSFAAGFGSNASGTAAIALGSDTAAGGVASFASGRGTLAPGYAQTSVGAYNAVTGSEDGSAWIPADPLFVVGNGINAVSRSNALTILKNGDVGIGTTSPSGKLEVAGKVKATELCIAADCRNTWPSGGSGEVNTASNVGTAGVGVYKQKTGVDLEFKKLNAVSNKLSIMDDAGNSKVDIDVNEANLSLANIGGTVPVAKGGTGVTSLGTYSLTATDGSGVVTPVAGSVNGSMLQYSATGPVYSSAAYPATTTAGQLLYSSANNVVGGLTTANNAILTTDGSGIPSWSMLSSDSFTQYALLVGRSGGQDLRGGTGSGEDLTLESTSHATKGGVILQPNGGNVGIGTGSPSQTLEVAGNVKISGTGSGLMFPDGTVLTTASLGGGGSVDIQTFEYTGAPQTWTKPSGTIAFIQCWGGGGAGGRTTSSYVGGGGGGASVSRIVPLTLLGATETVTIGAGGAGSSANSSGADGGNSTFGSWVTAYGGGGGQTNGDGGGGGGTLGAGSGAQAGLPVAASVGTSGCVSTDVDGNCTGTAIVTLTHLGTGGQSANGSGGAGGATRALNGGTALEGGGGGGGCQSTTTRAPGSSVRGGSGGAAACSGGVAASGSVPGGGGGGSRNGTSGAGGAGRCQVISW